VTAVTRRALVAGAGAGAGLALAPPAFARAATGGGFLWGAATAAHQVEGNNVASDIWLLEQVRPTLFAEPSGDACDSLHRWREDIAIVRALGLNCYRFSVEWARIEPAEGQISQAYLDHYARMIAHCRDSGIRPVVTLHHFTSPRWFSARGGWEQPDAPDRFAAFVDRVARRMGDGIDHAVTFNEPNLGKLGEWSATPMSEAVRRRMRAMLAAAAKASGSDRFSLLNAGDPDAMIAPVIAAHRLARAALKAVRGDLPVGMSLAIPDDQPAGAGSRIEEKRRAVYEPFFAAAREDDFIGVQTYSRSRIGPDGALPPPDGAERTQTGDEYYPQAIGNSIRYAHRATEKPVLVTENGIATADDAQRARFIPAAIASVDAARRDGVPVLGYIHWSLLDNFEWFAGYGPKFGLVAVDRQTFARTVKPSAHVYADIVSKRS